MQDSFRVRPNLTVSAGLRYDITSPPVDVEDRASLFNQQTGSLQAVGTGGLPRAGYATDRNNWAPRVGAAWTVDAAETTVVRGAYGIHYNHSALAPSEGLYFNAPYFNFAAYFTSPLGLVTLSDPFPRGFPIPTPNPALGIQGDLRTPYLHEFNATAAAAAGADARRGGRVRRLARAQSHRLAGHQSAAARHGAAEPAARSAVCRHHVHRITGAVGVRQPSGAFPAALRVRLHDARRLHAREIDGRRVRIFHERRRPEFSAGQRQPRRGVGPLQLRRAPSFLGQLLLRPAVQLHDRGHRRHAERAAVHCRAAAGSGQQQHRPIVAGVWRERPPERQREHVRQQRRPEPVVQHRGVRDAGVRHLRQCGPEYSRRVRAIRT